MDYYQTQYQLLKGRSLAERAVERLKLQTHPELATGPMMNPWERVRGFFGRPPSAVVDPSGMPPLPGRGRLPLADRRGPAPRLAPREPALPRLRPAGGRRRGERARPALHRAVARAALHDLDRGHGLALGAARGAAGEGGGGGEGPPGVPRARGAREPGGAPGARRAEARDAERRRARRAHRPHRQGDALQPDRHAGPRRRSRASRWCWAASRCRRSRPSSRCCSRRRPASPRRWATATPTWCACATQIRATAGEDPRRDAQRRPRRRRASTAPRSPRRRASRRTSRRSSARPRTRTASRSSTGRCKREVETNRQLYQDLLTKTKQTGLETELKTTNIRVVEKAETPRGPVSPNKMRNYQVAVILGLLVGHRPGARLRAHRQHVQDARGREGAPAGALPRDGAGRGAQDGGAAPRAGRTRRRS